MVFSNRFADFSKLMTPKSLEYARMLDNRKPRYVEEGEPVRIKCYDTVNANNAFT